MLPVKRVSGLIIAILELVGPLSGQQPVPLDQRYERIYCVVPIVGKGTWEDPKRPMFAPSRLERAAQRLAERGTTEPGKPLARILGYRYQVSDDGRFALVEFRANHALAFDEIMAHRSPDVKIFRIGAAKRQEIEGEFRRHKRDFDWDSFLGRIP